VPEAVLAALSDELNTPLAVSELHQLAAAGDAAGLRAGAEVMGLLTDALGGWDAEPEADADVTALIDGLLADRAAAKAAKDFAKADGIRGTLVEAGVEVKDVPGGAEWSLTTAFDAAKLAEGA
jgi:cysteinyl-tRNA synthetase